MRPGTSPVSSLQLATRHLSRVGLAAVFPGAARKLQKPPPHRITQLLDEIHMALFGRAFERNNDHRRRLLDKGINPARAVKPLDLIFP